MISHNNGSTSLVAHKRPSRKNHKLVFDASRSRKKDRKEERQDDSENALRKSSNNSIENVHHVTESRDESETLNEVTTSVLRYSSTSRQVTDDEFEYANACDYTSYPIASITSKEAHESSLKQSQHVPKDIWEAAKVGNSIAVHSFMMKDPFLAVHPSDNDRTPLFLAAHGGHLDTCKVLLDNGASDPNEECRLGALNKNIAKLIQSRALLSLNTAKLQILTVSSSDEQSQNQHQHTDDRWFDRIYSLICCPSDHANEVKRYAQNFLA